MENSSKLITRILTAILAVVLVCGAFCAGYFTRKCSQDRYAASYEWVLKTIADNYYGDFDVEQASDLSLKNLAGLLDRYSEYYTKEEYEAEQRDNSGVKSGVGITYNFVPGKGARIITVAGNSPAFRAGLKPGDVITGASYGGADVAFDNPSDITEFLNERVDGESFSFIRSDGSVANLSKREYIASYTCMYTNNSEWGFAADSKDNLQMNYSASVQMSYLPSDTAYIRLSQFYGTAAPETERLIKQFNDTGCTSLILDLRNNGGGYVSVMQEIAGFFVKDSNQTAMTAKYKNGREEVYYCKRQSVRIPDGTTVYVLANSGTASASEALIGALISHNVTTYENVFISDYSDEYKQYIASTGGEVKTARSYGKGIMQSTFRNNATGEALKLTTARIFWPNGKCIHDVGLTAADGCTIVGDVAWTATKDDEELQKVVEMIKNR